MAITSIISIISGSLFSSQQAQTSCSAATSDVIITSDILKISSRYSFNQIDSGPDCSVFDVGAGHISEDAENVSFIILTHCSTGERREERCIFSL